MSNLKCPFCQQELDMDMCGECGCPNEQCQKSVFMFGSEELWQELIRTRKALETENKDLSDKIGKLETELDRTRKALDRAKWWLNEIVESHRCTPISTAEMALKEIIEMEQKD